MRIITFEEKDALALLDQLRLESLDATHRWETKDRQLVSDIHRAFHFHVVRWLQQQGASCVR